MRRQAADGAGYDLLLLGNEAADTGDYQVGIRVAEALGWPCATGIKHLALEDGRVRARREYRGSEETFEFRLPAVITVKEGINLPRYPSLPGRLRAKRAVIERVPAGLAGRRAAHDRAAGARRAAPAGHRAGHRGGRGARAGRGAGRAGGAEMSVLCLVELDSAVPWWTPRCARWPWPAGWPPGRDGPGAGPLLAVTFGPAARLPLDVLGAAGVSEVHAVSRTSWTGYAPRAWARVLAGLATSAGAGAVLAAATDRGSEVHGLPRRDHRPADGRELPGNHPGRRRDLPAGPAALGRAAAGRRSAGGSPALATVSADAAPAEAAPQDAGRAAPGPVVHQHKPELTEADLRVRAAVSADQGGGVSLATARVVVGGGRGVGGPDGFAPLEELAGLLGGVVGVSRVVTSQGWRPHTQQVGQTGTKITPELYLACGISGAIQHMAGCGSAKHIIAVNTDPAAPIMSRADYAVIGDLGEVIPALIAALRERG